MGLVPASRLPSSIRPCLALGPLLSLQQAWPVLYGRGFRYSISHKAF